MRDEFGNTKEDYVRRMDDVASSIVDGLDKDLPNPQAGQFPPTRTGHANLASRRRDLGFIEPESRTRRPEMRGHVTRYPSSHGGNRYHPYDNDQRHAQKNSSNFPSREPLQHGNSQWQRHPTDSAAAQRLAAASIVPSPYAANTPSSSSYSRRYIDAHQTGRSQAQPSIRRYRHLAGPAVDNESEDEEEDVEDVEAGKGRHLITAKDTKKSKKASKARDDSRRGSTRRNVNGELEWLAKPGSEGVLAVRHDDIRPQLIAMAEAERVALGVGMVHPDKPGLGQYNVTSFYQKHVHWGPNRDARPDILFDWEEDKVNHPRPERPGAMHWEEDGRIYVVLDPDDDPVEDWDIPATIASNIPGYKLEAMRRENLSLRHKDLWARMPRQINVGTDDQPIWQKLGDPNVVVNMPMERFRFHAGLCSWILRNNAPRIKAGLKKLYGDKLRNNNIKAFGRDITTKEIREAKLVLKFSPHTSQPLVFPAT